MRENVKCELDHGKAVVSTQAGLNISQMGGILTHNSVYKQ